MLMSPNERDLNLHAENDLGEGIPRIQVVTGGSIGRSILKSNNKEIIFNQNEQQDNKLISWNYYGRILEPIKESEIKVK